jgi:single-stranded DNA-specific DHH superfamily exonuclease
MKGRAMIRTLRTLVASMFFAALALGGAPAFAQEVKVPETAADHEELAKKYREEATQHRKMAEEHRNMAEAYAKSHPDPKGRGKNPWTVKMQKHCQVIAKGADKLATDAEKAADFHTLRSKELQGK